MHAAELPATDQQLFADLRSGNDGARAQLARRYLPLAAQLARRYQRGEEPLDDLFQVASLGLVKAIDRYDADRQTAFSTFAVPTILGELKRYFRDRTWSVRVPRDLQELVLRVEREQADGAHELRRPPAPSEIAARLGLGEDEILHALEARGAHRAVSLDAPRSADGESEPGETLGDALGTEEEGYALAEQRATIDQLMRSISPREREVLRLRFNEDLTQAEIGEIVGVSQMQVSRILRRAVDRMRLAACAGDAGG